MKYHTTAREVLFGVAAALLFTACCAYGVVHLGLVSPTNLLADRIFSRISRGDKGSITIGPCDRRYLFGVSASGFDVTYGDLVTLHTDTISSGLGLPGIILRILTGTGMVDVTISNPTGSVSIPAPDGQPAPGDAGKEAEGGERSIGWDVKIPSVMQRTAWRFTVENTGFTLDAADGSAQLAGGEIVASVDKGGKLSQAMLTVPSAVLDGKDGTLSLGDLTLFAEDSGRAFFRASSVDGSFEGTGVSLSDIRAEGIIGKGPFSVDLSLHDLSVTREDLSVTADLVSGTIGLSLGTYDGLFTAGEGSLESVSLSVNSLSARSEKMDLSLPLSSVLVTRAGDGWHADYRVAEGSEVLWSRGEKSLSVTDPSLTAQIDASLSSFRVESGAASAFWKDEKYSISASGIAAQAVIGRDGTVTDGSFSCSLSGTRSGEAFGGEVRGTAEVAGGVPHADVSFSDSYVSLIKPRFTGTLSYNGDDGGTASVRVTSGTELSTRIAVTGIASGHPSLTVNAEIDGLGVDAFDRSVSRFFPALRSFYDDKSTLRGSLHFNLDGEGKGRVQYDMAISSLKFGSFRFQAGSTATGAIGDGKVDFDELAFTIQNYGVVFRGFFELANWMPTGIFTVRNTTKDAVLASIDLRHISGLSFTYDVTAPPFPNFHLSGSLLQESDAYSSSATLTVGNQTYPISFRYVYDDQSLHAQSGDQLTVEGSIRNPFTLSVVARSFPFPETGHLVSATMSGSTSFRYVSKDDWAFTSQDASLSGVKIGKGIFALSGNVSVTPEAFDITDLTIDDGTETYTGRIAYAGTPLEENVRQSMTKPFTLSSHIAGGPERSLDLYIGRQESGVELMADLADVTFRTITGQDEVYNISLVGSTDMDTHNDLSGMVDVKGTAWDVGGSFIFDGTHLRADGLSLRIGETSLGGGSLDLDIDKGSFSFQGHMANSYHISRIDDSGTEADISLSLSFAPLAQTIRDVLPGDTLWDRIFSLFLGGDGKKGADLRHELVDEIARRGYTCDLGVKNLSLFGWDVPGFQDILFHLSWQDDAVNLTSPVLSGSWRPADGRLHVSLEPVAGIGFTADGILTDTRASISLRDVYADGHLINLFLPVPIADIKEGTILKGDLYMEGSLKDPVFYGQMTADNVGVWTLYTKDYDIYAKNALFTINGSTISTPVTPVYAVDRETGTVVHASTWLSLQLDGFIPTVFTVDIDVSGDKVKFYVPIPEGNMELYGTLQGTFHMDKNFGETAVATGSGILSDALIAIGTPKDCPSWYTSANVSPDMEFVTGTGGRLIYPNTDDPLVSIDIAEGDRMHFVYDQETGDFAVDGSLTIKSGEIFYFRKDFFITEGNIRLDTGAGGLEPVMNLTARLRDLDEDGQPVDIYLTLKDATMDNLNPVLESTPPKSTAEIMAILSGSIIPSDSGDTGLSQAAAVATMATDVAMRMGWFGTSPVADLSETIQQSLGLDMFSFRSYILQNFIVDALPGATGGVSPLARYLDNTTVFLGKYVAQDLFLQAILHLNAVEQTNIGPDDPPFMVNDLVLNLEISLDWQNPLCTFSVFTEPTELSLVNFFDKLGISAVKRIVIS